MLLLQNIEGDCYNPILDNYLVVKVVSYADTAFEELHRNRPQTLSGIPN